MELERYPLGINGLDEILGGGIPKHSTLLVIQTAMNTLRKGGKTEPI